MQAYYRLLAVQKVLTYICALIYINQKKENTLLKANLNIESINIFKKNYKTFRDNSIKVTLTESKILIVF